MGGEVASMFGGGYSDRSSDLTRYVDDPLDDRISDTIAGLAAKELQAWGELRERLAADDCYALFAFADRRAALALRTGSEQFAAEALLALALMVSSRIDYRDLSVDFPVYALRQTSRDPAPAIAFAHERSDEAIGKLLRSRASGRLTLHDCEFVEVRSRHGLGFMHTSWNPPPNDPGLLEAAIEIADRIDAGRRYEVRTLALSRLPWVWFDPSPEKAQRGKDIATTGCVAVHVDVAGKRWSNGPIVFVADMADEQVARAVADLARGASRKERPQTALSNGARLLTVIGDSMTPGSLYGMANDLAEVVWRAGRVA